VSNI
jgi:hypothetical protein